MRYCREKKNAHKGGGIGLGRWIVADGRGRVSLLYKLWMGLVKWTGMNMQNTLQ